MVNDDFDWGIRYGAKCKIAGVEYYRDSNNHYFSVDEAGNKIYRKMWDGTRFESWVKAPTSEDRQKSRRALLCTLVGLVITIFVSAFVIGLTYAIRHAPWQMWAGIGIGLFIIALIVWIIWTLWPDRN